MGLGDLGLPPCQGNWEEKMGHGEGIGTLQAASGFLPMGIHLGQMWVTPGGAQSGFEEKQVRLASCLALGHRGQGGVGHPCLGVGLLLPLHALVD